MAQLESTTTARKINPFIIGIIILALIIGGIGIYYFIQYQRAQDLLKNPSLAAQVEGITVLANVSKLMDLPKDEQPTIATVTDYTKLNKRPFFAKAQNGDRVLIYTKAKEAVLYRPSDNKIITVGPINTASTTVVSAISPTPAVIRIALYNGTTTTGLTKTIEQKLETSLTNISIGTKTNAAKSDYISTLVIGLNTQLASVSSQIAHVLGGQVGSLPAGESKPENTDVLVIVGKNYR